MAEGKRGRPEVVYIAICATKTIEMPLRKLAEYFNCSPENIMMNSIKGSQKKAFGELWSFDISLNQQTD